MCSDAVVPRGPTPEQLLARQYFPDEFEDDEDGPAVTTQRPLHPAHATSGCDFAHRTHENVSAVSSSLSITCQNGRTQQDSQLI